jgi:hypothetical protein
MANMEHALLSHIIRHGKFQDALRWGICEHDFRSNEGFAIFQELMEFHCNPNYNGGQMGIHAVKIRFPEFTCCDDDSMTLEAYCERVRKQRRLLENASIARALVDTDDDPAVTASRCMEMLRKCESECATGSASRRTPAAYAAQPSDEETRNQYIIPDLQVCVGPPMLLVGAGYTGKTATAQSLALSVATGNKVWGHFDCRKGKVLHADGEQGKMVTEQRYRQLARGLGIDLTQLDSPVVDYRPPPLVVAEKHSRLACNELAWESFVRGFELVIVDNLSALSPGLQENSSEVRMVLDMLARVSERTGAAFVLLHHTVKPGPHSARGRASIRGSGAIFDAAATVLVLERDEIMSDHARVTSPKARGGLDANPPAPFVISKLRVGEDAYQLNARPEDAQCLSRTIEGQIPAHIRIVRALSQAGGRVSGMDALRKAAGIGAAPCRNGVKTLVAQGVLRREGRAIVLVGTESSGPTIGESGSASENRSPYVEPCSGRPSLRTSAGARSVFGTRRMHG